MRPNTRSTSKGDVNNRYSSIAVEDHPGEYQAKVRTPIVEEAKSSEDELINEAEHRLQESSIKESHFRSQLQALEDEKRRIDFEKQSLLMEKNKETAEWERRYQSVVRDHEGVIANLKDANRVYQAQVGENEHLKAQLNKMQLQH